MQGKELRTIGYPEGPVISIAMNVMQKNYKHHTKDEAMEILKNILAVPGEFENDEVLGLIAKGLIKSIDEPIFSYFKQTLLDAFGIKGSEQF